MASSADARRHRHVDSRGCVAHVPDALSEVRAIHAVAISE